MVFKETTRQRKKCIPQKHHSVFFSQTITAQKPRPTRATTRQTPRTTPKTTTKATTTKPSRSWDSDDYSRVDDSRTDDYSSNLSYGSDYDDKSDYSSDY